MSERPQNKHLKPFKKGDDPRRCKRGKQALPDLKELIEAIGDEGMEVIVQALFNQAKKGNIKAIQELFDRYYGKVKQENTNVNLNTEISKEDRHRILDNLKNGR